METWGVTQTSVTAALAFLAATSMALPKQAP
jgi:hypothetical protein